MNKENFDYYWRIALIIVLVIFFCIFIFEFVRFNKQGAICLNDPLAYATKHLADEGIYTFKYNYNNYECLLNCQNSMGYVYR